MIGFMKVLSYALITLFLGVVLKELGFKGTRLVMLLGTVSLIGASMLAFGEVFANLPGIGSDNREYARALMKIIGVGYIFGICSDICTEMGEIGLGSAVCLFGRVEIIALSLPFIKRIVEKGIELL